MKINALLRLKLGIIVIGFCIVCAARATPVELVTAREVSTEPSLTGGGDSWDSMVTPDGRYVVFASAANNLALSASNVAYVAQVPPVMNVFRRDRASGVTTLVSVNLKGTGGGDSDSWPRAVSSNGQYILFESSAGNLAAGDTNNAGDIFLRDVVDGVTRLVSVSTNGGCADGDSGNSVMTPDGRFVAFGSLAANLVDGDTNGIQDIFVRDMDAGVTRIASSEALPTGIPPFRKMTGFDAPEITPDGRFVAFLGTMDNFMYRANDYNEVYVCDLLNGTTTPVSTNAQAILGSSIHSSNHELSSDGQFAAWESISYLASTNGFIFRYNLASGVLELVSSNAVSAMSLNLEVQSLDMTPDGRFVRPTGTRR